MNPQNSTSPRPRVALDHIGIAVAQVPQLSVLFRILGLGIDHSEAVQDQGVTTHFLPLPVEPLNLEFLEPLAGVEGPVAQFLNTRGPGIHHLAFRVQAGELDGLLTELSVAGFRLIYPTPRLGAHGMRINFIHPKSAGGMLIELNEPGAA